MEIFYSSALAHRSPTAHIAVNRSADTVWADLLMESQKRSLVSQIRCDYARAASNLYSLAASCSHCISGDQVP
jgi:hypothetical protein